MRCPGPRDCADSGALGIPVTGLILIIYHRDGYVWCDGCNLPDGETSHHYRRGCRRTWPQSIWLLQAGSRVFETNTEPGGKMHQRQVGDVGIDAGLHLHDALGIRRTI